MAVIVSPIEQKELWESFVERNFPNALFQSWLWGDVQKKLGVPLWRLGFYRDKKLIGVAQVVKVVAKRGTFLHIRHGPLLLEMSPHVWELVFTSLKKLAKEEHCWFIRTSPLVPDTQNARQLFLSIGAKPSPIHAMDGEDCWILDVDPPEEELLAHMRKTTRYEIRKAIKLGVTVKEGGESDLAAFLALYKNTTARHRFVPHKGIAEEFSIFFQSNKAQLLLGSYNNTTIAGAIILYYGNQAIYHHGASLQSPIPVSYLVQWEGVKQAKKRGLRVYNFWGIAPEGNAHHPWAGISLFKRGFGGHQVQYIHSQDIAVSPLWVITHAIELVRRLKKGYS